MVYRSTRFRILALILSFLTIVATAPFSMAETIAAAPLGTIVTAGSVTVGNASAPTGTTVFAGDKVASSQPALINFGSGSRIEMTKAAATFARKGKTLVIQADQGLLRFAFMKGESVQINAGKFQFMGLGESRHAGELGLNANGEIVMNVTEGAFAALNTETGASTEVTPDAPMAVTNRAPAAAANSGSGSGALTAAIVAGVVGTTVLIVGIYEATKSASSR